MDLFYELVRVSLGTQDTLSYIPSESEWWEIFEIAQKHTVVGVMFEALETLHAKGIMPPQELIYEWIGADEQIKQQNILLNKHCVEITQIINEAGFRVVF